MHTHPRTWLARAAAALALLLVAALAATPLPAAEHASKPEASKLPPLIDRDMLFGDPELSGAQISPDGKWISFQKPHRDVMNIWVKKAADSFEKARPMTADTERPVRGYFWTEDSRYILYVQDKGGDENFHIYAVDPKAKPDAGTGVPPARDLTPVDGVRAMIAAVPEKTPNRIIVGLNDRDPAMHDIYELNIDTGERKLLVKNESNVAAWITDLDGKVRLAWRTTADGGSELLVVENGALGKSIYSCNYLESCQPARFHKDGKKVYITSDKGDDVDLSRLMLLDVATGKAKLVDSDPKGEVDFGGPIFSEKTEELIGTVYVGDRLRIYPRTEELKKDLAFLRANLPDGELNVGATTEDESLWIVSVRRDVNPGEVWLYDRKHSNVTKLYDSRPDLPTEHLATVKPIRYSARDGVEIPGYLTLPRGVQEKNLPAIVLPHGGPWARDTWGWDPFAQFLANRGYAVLQPNFRGSTGYGKAFLNAGNNEWGTGIMQHDLTDAVKYLVTSGIADPKKIAIMGGSYGGYATLAGVTFTPDLYAAGISIVGPSNIITLLDSIPPYWGPIRKIFEKRVGDPEDPEDRKRLEAQSPFYHAKQIKAPLLVIQGANDPRVKKAESDQIVVALRELKRPVEYFVAPDEGHGFAGEENRLAMFAVIEEFLAGRLGGRHQESARPEVATRIASLRVDVNSVEMPSVPAGAEMAQTAPLPVPDTKSLKPVTLQYRSELKLAAGPEFTIESTRKLASGTHAERAVWRIEQFADTPQGKTEDVFILDKESLLPVRRMVKQGPANVTLDFGANTVTGSIKMPGQELPIDAKLDAQVFGNEAALDAVITALPLEEGYSTVVRTFDVMSQKVQAFRFEVVGAESVEVPAGTFDALKATMTPFESGGAGGTLWISRNVPRRIVKTEYTIPAQVGGGSVSSVLTSVTDE